MFFKGYRSFNVLTLTCMSSSWKIKFKTQIFLKIFNAGVRKLLKIPNSKHFRFCGSYDFYYNYSTLPL